MAVPYSFFSLSVMARGGPHSSINLQICIYLLDPKLKKTTGAHYSKVHIGSRAFTTYFQSVSLSVSKIAI